MTRRHPNLTEKLASALLDLLWYRGDGIAYSEARLMTAAQICSLVRWDHSVHHTWGGTTHPTNITARLIKASREHTRKVDVPQITKVRRHAKKQARLMPVDVTGAMGDEMSADARRARMAQLRKAVLGSRPIPGSKASSFKKKMNGKVERRP